MSVIHIQLETESDAAVSDTSPIPGNGQNSKSYDEGSGSVDDARKAIVVLLGIVSGINEEHGVGLAFNARKIGNVKAMNPYAIEAQKGIDSLKEEDNFKEYLERLLFNAFPSDK